MYDLPHIETVPIALHGVDALSSLCPKALVLLFSGSVMDLIDIRLQLLHHILRWQVDLINGQLEQVVDHSRQQNLQQARRLLKAGICVDLDQPDVKVLIDEVIEAKQLKAVLAPVWIDLFLDSS